MTTTEWKRAVDGVHTPEGMEQRLLAAMLAAKDAPEAPARRRAARQWVLPACAAAAVLLLAVSFGMLRQGSNYASSDTAAPEMAESRMEDAPVGYDGGEAPKDGGTNIGEATESAAAEVTAASLGESYAPDAVEIALTLTNAGTETYTYGDAWGLEKQDADGTWVTVAPEKEMIAAAIGYTLPAGGTARWRGDAAVYGAVWESGQYRVVKTLTAADGAEVTVTAAFTVT